MVSKQTAAKGKGQWALVLGCSVGSGAAIAQRLAEQNGLNIVGFHRGNFPGDAERLRADVEATGARCVLLEADAGRVEDIPALIDQVRSSLAEGERIAIMIHALTGASLGPVVCPEAPEQAIQPKQILRTFEAMAHSFLFWGQALVHQALMGADSQILALLNYQDEMTPPGFVAIGGLKGALTAYVRHMALEFPSYGVRVNGLRFGAADTEALSHVPRKEIALRQIAEASPMGRNVNVDDVADFVSLLCDERAGFMNGSIIPFDGGETAAYAVKMLDTTGVQPSVDRE
jgi:NAD(P)-dependent dehydrogenase (short-subunit alcohol dehydrogenase family)